MHAPYTVRNDVHLLFVTIMVGRIRWVNISSPVNFKIFYDSFMTFNSCVKYVLKPQDGAGMCTPKAQG